MALPPRPARPGRLADGRVDGAARRLPARASTTASATRPRSARTGPTSRWCCSRTPTRCARSSGSTRRSRPPGRAGSSCARSPAPTRSSLLDGEEHLRERRLIQAPFHGERMRALAPTVAELARRELGSWSGRVVTLERMKRLTLEIDPAGACSAPATSDEAAAAARRGRTARSTRCARCRACSRWRSCSATSGRAARGAASGSPSSASTRCCSTSWRAGAREPRRRLGARRCCSSSATRTATRRRDRHLRDQLVALLVAGHDTSAASLAWAFERLARHPDVHARLREGDPAYLDAVVKEVLRVRPALTIAPRRLLEPVRIAGRTLPAGVQVAACLWLAMRREDLWPQAARLPARALARGRAAEPDVLDPVRRRRAPLRGRAVRRDGDARGARARPPSCSRSHRCRPEPERARRSALVVTPDRGGEVLARRR